MLRNEAVVVCVVSFMMHTRYDVVAVSSEVKQAWMLQTAHSFLLGSYRAESSRPKFYVWPC